MRRLYSHRLSVVRFLGLGALVLGGVLASLTPAAAATRPNIGGKVTSEPGSAAPTIFTMQRHNGKTATVVVSTSTVVLRRYGAHSDISAVNEGDSIQVWGSFQAGTNTFNATQIRDNSIQSADAYGRGVVKSTDVAANSITVRMTLVPYGSPLARQVTVELAPGQSIPLPGPGSTTISGLHVGDTLSLRGIYDRASTTLTHLDAIRVLKVVTTPAPPVNLKIVGFTFMGQHFALIRIHTAAGATLQVIFHINGRTYTITGTANSYGNFQAQRVVGTGNWYGSRHLESVTTVTSSGAQRQITKWAWIG